MTTTTGLLHVIEKYAHGDNELQSKQTNENKIYINIELDFVRKTTLHKRNIVMQGNFHKLQALFLNIYL